MLLGRQSKTEGPLRAKPPLSTVPPHTQGGGRTHGLTAQALHWAAGLASGRPFSHTNVDPVLRLKAPPQQDPRPRGNARPGLHPEAPSDASVVPALILYISEFSTGSQHCFLMGSQE